MSCKDGEPFVKAYKEGAEAHVLLKVLEPTVLKITNSVTKSTKVHNLIVVSKEDVAQEVRLFLWTWLPEIKELDIANPLDVFKYITTMMKRKALRYIMEERYTNPRLKARRRVKEKGVNVSEINLEFFDFRATYPVDSLITLFKTRCKTIKNAEIIFEFLTTQNDTEKFAGLNQNVYFNTVSEMKQLAKDIAFEVAYD